MSQDNPRTLATKESLNLDPDVKAAIGICLVLNVLEFLCFALIFAEMRVHHKRHVALCLANKPGVARRKKRRNVITAAGHFISWVSG